MKVTVLGGAAACPNPGQGSSAYLVEIGGTTSLVDCGPNTISELRKHIELDDIDQILISHFHSDHTLDLVPYRYGLRYIPGMKPRRVPLWLPPNGHEFLSRVANAFAMGTEPADDFFDVVFDVRIYSAEEPLAIGSASVRFFQTNHPVPCWAMRFESTEGTLVYLADTGPQDNLVDIARNADILICEGTFLSESGDNMPDDRPHITACEAGEIGREAGVGELILTHYWASLGPDRYLADAESRFGRPVRLAHPGLVITGGSPSNASREEVLS
jgi:ribonuclease BN (tRNA processing enzyme)